MDFVKLKTRYYDDVAIMRAGEAAEVLFTRGLAYAGDQETDGFVPKEALVRLTPTRGMARVRALVREGLWHVVDGGWRITGWDRHQTTREQLEQKREAGRQRIAKHRAKNTRSNAVGNAVTDSERCSTEVREKREEDAAAAASAPLPPPVEILRARLNAANPKFEHVRWDNLTPAQLDEITALVELHGDRPLVQRALTAWRADAPLAYAQGWLSGWRTLTPPGTPLQLVDTPCLEPGHSGTTRHCTQCAAEQIAAR